MGAGAEDARWTNLGSSLTVPNVQALAESGHLTEVPDRYIRPEILTGDDVFPASVEVNIPVLDMERLLDPESSEEEAAKLHMACEEWGFFQLINHGVPDDVTQGIKDNLQGFFKQSLEVRMKSAQLPGTIEGYGQVFVVSEQQKLDWADILFLYTHPSSIRKHDLWPEQPPTFRAALEAYSKEVKKVSGYLFHLMAKNLGLDRPEKLTGMMEDGIQGIRMNYYPPCPLAHDKVIGLSPHSDAVALTLLLQVNAVPGLQIRSHGKWLPVYPHPGALIVNIGDVIEILSNGKYKSIEHRAIVDKHKERLSIAAFHSSDLDSMVGPLSDFCKENHPCYKTVTSLEYTRLLFASKLEGKNILDQMKLDC